MSELKHWLNETSEADDFERAILRAALDADPSEAQREEVWSGLMTSLALAPLAAATATSHAASVNANVAVASKAATVFTTVAKGFLVGLAIYGASVGVSEISNRFGRPRAGDLPAQAMLTPPRRAIKGPAQPVTIAPSAAPIASTEDAPSIANPTQRSSASVSAAARAPIDAAAALPSAAAFDDSKYPSNAGVSQLEAETRALLRARAESRAGKLADAFATLEASRRQFSTPELYQEREALTIELLSRSGQAFAAEQRARAFLSRFPESPHAQQVQTFTTK